MLKVFSITAVLFLGTLFSSIYGNSYTEIPVDISELIFTEKGIFYANEMQAATPVEAVQFKNGEYSVKMHILGIWKCQACGYLNSRMDDYCASCGKPQPKK